MGCGSSVRAEAPVASPEPAQDHLAKAAAQDSAELQEELRKAEEGADEAAEYLTLGASEGVIHNHYIIGQRIGASCFPSETIVIVVTALPSCKDR